MSHWHFMQVNAAAHTGHEGMWPSFAEHGERKCYTNNSETFGKISNKILGMKFPLLPYSSFDVCLGNSSDGLQRSYEHIVISKHVFNGMNIRWVMDWILDLLITSIHHSELHFTSH
jgi:hypothetical protein